MPRKPITKANPYYSQRHDRLFHTEREYRNFLAERKGYRNWYAQQRSVRPHSDETWLAAPQSYRDEHTSALRARSRMLAGETRRSALAIEGLSDAKFQRHVGGTVTFRAGRWVATRRRPFRRERMLSARGMRMVHPANDAQASRVAQHWNAAKALNAAANTPEEAQAIAALAEFDDDRIDGEAFMTDPDDVLDFFETNPDSFESIYEEVA